MQKIYLFCLLAIIFTNHLHSQTVNQLLLQGEYEKAYEEGLEQLEGTPNSLDLLFKTGLACKKTDRHKEAVELFRKASALDSTNHLFSIQLGESYDQLGLWSTATKCYQKALTQKLDDPVALRALAKILFREDKFSQAGTCYASLERLFPQKSLYSRMLAICLLKKGDPKEAYAKMLEAYQKDTLDIKTIINLSNIQIRGGLNNKALEVLKNGLDAHPDHPKLNYLAGKAHYSNNHHFRALPHFKKLLQQGDSSFNVLRFAGNSFYSTKRDKKKGIELMEKAYPMDSTYLPLLRELYNIHQKEKNYAKALYYRLREGDELYPTAGEDYHYKEGLAWNYKLVGDYTKALRTYKDLEALILKNPKKHYYITRAYVSIARIYDEGLKDKKQAIVYYKKYLNTFRNIPKVGYYKKLYDEVELRINFLKEEQHFEGKSGK